MIPGTSHAYGPMMPPPNAQQPYMPPPTTYGSSNLGSYPQTPMTPGSPFPQVPTNTQAAAIGATRPSNNRNTFALQEEPTNEDFSNTESVGGGVSLDPAIYNNPPTNRWGAARGMGRGNRGSRQ